MSVKYILLLLGNFLNQLKISRLVTNCETCWEGRAEREPVESGWSLKASLKEGTLKLRATSAGGMNRSTEGLGGRPGNPSTRSQAELWGEPAVTAVARRMSVTYDERSSKSFEHHILGNKYFYYYKCSVNVSK